MFCHWHERRSRRTRQVHPLEQGAGEPGGGQMAARSHAQRRRDVARASCQQRAERCGLVHGCSCSSSWGREGAFERGVLRRVQRVQQHAKDMAGERRVQQQQYGVKPEKLVVPSEEHPSSMFDPGTWAMAYPDLFPYGDGVPFLVRETKITALEVFQYLLCRDELSYTGPGEASYEPPQRTRWTASASRRNMAE